MGSSHSQALPQGASHFNNEFTEHPLLIAIDNPINRFCDDFASSLIEDTSQRNPKTDPQFGGNELEEIDGYTIMRKLGNGAEANVYEAAPTGTLETLALKKYKKVRHMSGAVPREVEIAQMLDHPNIIKINNCFQTMTGDFVVAMPLSHAGALKTTNRPEITVISAVLLLRQIGSALAYMHSQNIVHRDIKPGNILLFEWGFSLCDFSISIHVPDDSQLSGVVGTSAFMAPEISNSLYRPKPTDMWALGVTVYSLLYGEFPFEMNAAMDQTEISFSMNLARNIEKIPLVFPEIPAIPDEMKEIISRLLDKNPQTRMTAEELDVNSWLQEKEETWRKMISFIKGEA